MLEGSEGILNKTKDKYGKLFVDEDFLGISGVSGHRK
jgi:hypothetical protein